MMTGNVNLIKVIKELAEQHVQIREKGSASFKEQICRIYPPVENSEDIYKALIQNTTDKTLMESSQLIKELGTLVQNRSTTVASIEDVMIYELLMVIFGATNSVERSLNFHKLLQVYHDRLKDRLVDLDDFKIAVNRLLPYAKLDTTARLIKAGSIKELKDFSEEFLEYFNNKVFLREDCYGIVEKIRSTGTDYRFLSYEIVLLTSTPGFIGDYYKLKLQLRNGDREETFHIFVKFVTDNVPDICQKIGKFSFAKEKFFYETLIPKLEEFGLESNFAPKCWLTRKETFVAMEDLQIQDYVTGRINLDFDFKWTWAIMKFLARFHSSSLILEEKWSKTSGRVIRLNEEYKEFLQEVLFTTEIETGLLMSCSVRMVRTYFVDKLPNIPRKVTVEQFKKYLAKTEDRICANISASKKYRNTVGHGDLWPPNILYKNNEAGEPVSCRLIDFQNVRYCPPIIDVTFLIYFTANKETRDKYMSFLLEEYYKELSECFKLYQVDVEEVYSHETFLESFRELRLYAVWAAICYTQPIYLPAGLMPPNLEEQNRFWIEDRSMYFEQAMENPIFYNKITDLIQEMYDLCETDILLSIKSN